MSTWTSLALPLNSHVMFYRVSTNYPFDPYYVDLMRNRLAVGLAGLAQRAWYWTGTTYRIGYATLTMSILITDPHYFESTVAHEAGHTFAFGDCPDCNVNDTIMGYDGAVFNSPTVGRTTPSSCDIQVSHQAAY
jgi:hypothetical protein